MYMQTCGMINFII